MAPTCVPSHPSLAGLAAPPEPRLRSTRIATASPGRSVARRLLREARRVARETGKSMTRQLAEVVALRLADGHLRPLHYYQYQLYDDRLYPWSAKREFIDWDPTRICNTVNDGDWRAFAKDKVDFATFMRGAGMLHAQIVALFHWGRATRGARCACARVARPRSSCAPPATRSSASRCTGGSVAGRH